MLRNMIKSCRFKPAVAGVLSALSQYSLNQMEKEDVTQVFVEMVNVKEKKLDGFVNSLGMSYKYHFTKVYVGSLDILIEISIGCELLKSIEG